MNPVFRAFLQPVGLYLLAIGLLAGVHLLLAAVIAGWLRQRQPTVEARRAYLLRGLAHRRPRLSPEQRLERVRQGRWLAGALTFGFPVMFLGEVLCRWLGVTSSEGLALKIELAGLCACLPTVVCAAYAAARARLANDVLDATPASPSTPPA